MIKYAKDTSGVHCNTLVREWKFPDGAIGVDIQAGSDLYPERVSRIWVDARIKTSDDIMALVMTMDALRQVYKHAAFALYMPYIPYARQDRVCNAGEAFSLKAMGSIINMLNFVSVLVVDPHSAVAAGVIDKMDVYTQVDIFKDIKDDWSNIVLVAPDMGASKKTEDFAKAVGAKGILYCNKRRNLTDGKILGLTLLNPEILSSDSELLVLDDICDGGRTFLEVADAIAAVVHVKTIELAVTHGIFSKGVNAVACKYNHIYTTDSIAQEEATHSCLTVIELE